MIKYNPKNWFQLIFGFHKSDTFRILWKELVYIFAFSIGLAFLEITYFPDATYLSGLISVYSLVGFVISLLLVFRTNTAYDRWWEGRKKWGEMVNDSRNLAVKISTLKFSKEENNFFRRMISNFAFATKEHLRKSVNLEELDITAEEKKALGLKNHVPVEIIHLMFKHMNQLKSEGKLSEMEYLAINDNLDSLMDSLGACERILNTPIPYSYSLFLKKFIFIYTTTLPLAFISTFGYGAAIISTFVFYVLVSMEILAEEIEDPFGLDDNDLPTDQLCVTIKGNVDEVFS